MENNNVENNTANPTIMPNNTNNNKNNPIIKEKKWGKGLVVILSILVLGLAGSTAYGFMFANKNIETELNNAKNQISTLTTEKAWIDKKYKSLEEKFSEQSNNLSLLKQTNLELEIKTTIETKKATINNDIAESYKKIISLNAEFNKIADSGSPIDVARKKEIQVEFKTIWSKIAELKQSLLRVESEVRREYELKLKELGKENSWTWNVLDNFNEIPNGSDNSNSGTIEELNNNTTNNSTTWTWTDNSNTNSGSVEANSNTWTTVSTNINEISNSGTVENNTSITWTTIEDDKKVEDNKNKKKEDKDPFSFDEIN